MAWSALFWLLGLKWGFSARIRSTFLLLLRFIRSKMDLAFIIISKSALPKFSPSSPDSRFCIFWAPATVSVSCCTALLALPGLG